VWTYDHLSGVVLHGSRALDLWTALGALAAVTTRVSIGPLVANCTVRHPAHINSAVATLQELSGGRLRLGLGAGAGPESPFARELTMLGFEPHRAAARRAVVADTVGYLRALWSRTPEYEGTGFGFAGVGGVLVPDPAPPMIVGANGPRMAALAGECADGVNVHEFTPDAPGLLKIARDAATAAGRQSFALTVEAPLTDQWLDRDSDERGDLETLGVSRVMLRWSGALGVPEIARAARYL
jgi:alkanesulfonate monooxygenase SsuD/methylene tetrahydromethanopterin reductase-like flavin-dependent oxidoreductase (luciferase family)